MSIVLRNDRPDDHVPPTTRTRQYSVPVWERIHASALIPDGRYVLPVTFSQTTQSEKFEFFDTRSSNGPFDAELHDNVGHRPFVVV
jgi:hypothetical protein